MYQLAKDFVLPLLGPIVALFVPTIVFYILPRRRDRQKAAFDLYATYAGEEMRKSRLEVWAYFFAQVADNPQEQSRRFEEYLDYLMAVPTASAIPPERWEIYQKATRVLDYFVLVEGCIQQGLVNEQLVKCYLARFYLWWRDDLMIPLRKRREITSNNPREVPMWWRPLANLDRITCVCE